MKQKTLTQVLVVMVIITTVCAALLVGTFLEQRSSLQEPSSQAFEEPEGGQASIRIVSRNSSINTTQTGVST